jgi:hypothetical protein
MGTISLHRSEISHLFQSQALVDEVVSVIAPWLDIISTGFDLIQLLALSPTNTASTAAYAAVAPYLYLLDRSIRLDDSESMAS